MNIKQAGEMLVKQVYDYIELCPHCGARVHIKLLWYGHHLLRNKDVEFYVAYRCVPCNKIIIKTCYFYQLPTTAAENLEFGNWLDKYPLSLDSELPNVEKEYVPREVVEDFDEALKCRSIKACRAACAMFRRALQSSLLKLGADPKFDLVKQIESLPDLPKDVKDWAHQIRILGNWGAHPDADNLKEVDENDVNTVLEFTEQFLQYTFIMPEKVKASRTKRDEKFRRDLNLK